MTTPDERDMQAHEATHPGCNERYWRERAQRWEGAARHFWGCKKRGCELCSEHARALGLIVQRRT
jgi:hypothetical protein